MIIPGQVITLFTFPGVIIHEIAHRLFADLVKIPVYEICYFQFSSVLKDSEPAGYIIHEPVKTLKQAFFITFGPFFLNTILCAFIIFSAVIPNFILHITHHETVHNVILWIGLSIGMHAFPSNNALDSLINILKQKDDNIIEKILQYCAFLLIGALKIGNFSTWFSVLYAFAVAFSLPLLLGLY